MTGEAEVGGLAVRPGHVGRHAGGGGAGHRHVRGQQAGRHQRASRRARWRWWPVAAALTAVTVASIFVAVSSQAPAISRPGDPLSSAQLFVDKHSSVAAAQAAVVRSDPAASAILGRIASVPTGIWLGPWNQPATVASIAATVLVRAQASHSLPLLVLYAFPYRGCTPGTAAATGTYERWVSQVAAGIGMGRAAVVIEPDALAQDVTLSCLSAAEQAARVAIIRQAVDRLARLPHVTLYLDAGNSRWQSAAAMAALLTAAGVGEARGFALNVSNFYSTPAEEAYGDRIGALLHGAHYVVDTSRNGLATANTWCNPPGQALGAVPTVNTGRTLADALLWIKPPGVSDGTCNGGPEAGVFWPAYALGLAAGAHW